MTLTTWLSLLAACLVISCTPGAGAINTMSTSLRYGWARAIFTILGQQLALIAQILIVAAGLGVLVASSPTLFDAIRYLGAAYLVYLGVRMIFARTGSTAETAQQDGGQQTGRRARLTPGSALDLAQRGFWVNMSNPKAIVFIVAFMPQFIRTDLPQLPQYLIFTVTMVVGDIVVMWGGFALIARAFTRLNASVRGQRVLNLIFGVLFIAVAALLVFAVH